MIHTRTGANLRLIAVLGAVAGVLGLAAPAFGQSRGWDPGYGTGGYTYFPGGDSYFADLAVYSTGPNAGKTLAVGGAGDVEHSAVVARFNSDGSFDTSFSGDGIVRIHHPGSEFGGGQFADDLYSVAIDADGKLIVAGGAFRVGGYVARFNADGTLDTDGDADPSVAFGPDGSGYTVLAPSVPRTLALPPGGSDNGIFAGARTGATPDRTRVYRLGKDGDIVWSREITLGPNAGSTPPDVTTTPDRLLLEPDLDVVVGGIYLDATRQAWGVARLKPDGTVDTSFGDNGGTVLFVADRSSDRFVGGLVLDSAGRILVGGSVQLSLQTFPGVLMRLNSDGAVDGGFGFAQSGKTSPSGISDLVLDGGGRAIASGALAVEGSNGVRSQPAAMRFDEDGKLDQDFGVCGVVSGPVVLPSTGIRLNGTTQAVALDGIGIVVGGRNSTSVPQAFVGRFPLDGGFTGDASCGDDSGGGGDVGVGGGSGQGGVAGGVATNARNINVHKVIVPKSLGKLIHRGVRVLASCDEDCRIVVEVRVSPGIADAMGLGGTLLAKGSGPGPAGQPKWVVAKLSGTAARALRSYGGGGRLHVDITGVAG